MKNKKGDLMKLKFTNIGIQNALGLSAASALIYEVVATHLLFFYFVESSYSIATVLSVFLFGLAIGSLTIHYISDKIKNKKLIFAALQIIIAIYAFLILSNLRNILPNISTFGTVLTSFIILLAPTIFLGAIFPLAGSMFKKEKKELIGLVYSSDLVGAILGSLLAGFLLIPYLGARIAVIIGAILNITSALIIIPKKQKIIPVFLLLIIIGTTFNIPSIATDKPYLTYEEEQYYEDGYQFYANSPYGLVAVKDGALYIEDAVQCSCSYSETASERMMANYSLEPLSEENKQLMVLNIGLGCGLTLERCLEYNTLVDVVEINEQVVKANMVISNVLENTRVTLIIDEGLNYLTSGSKIYDSILIDIQRPSLAHTSSLYTVDAFEIISQSLTEKGTFALWHYGSGNDDYCDILYYSMKEAFPYVYSYYGVFLASKQKLDETEYEPTTPYKINTIDRNTLADA